jgi:hypothetical protein
LAWLGPSFFAEKGNRIPARRSGPPDSLALQILFALDHWFTIPVSVHFVARSRGILQSIFLFGSYVSRKIWIGPNVSEPLVMAGIDKRLRS